MGVYSFIAIVLLILVETRAAGYKNVEVKFGSNSIIIPLKNHQPVQVTRIKGVNFVDLNVPIPDLVELILQSRGLATVRPALERKPLSPERQVSSEDNTKTTTQNPQSESNLLDRGLLQKTNQFTSTPSQYDDTTEHYSEDGDENESVESASQTKATHIKDYTREPNNTYDQNSQPDDVKHKYIKNYVTYEDIMTNKTIVNKYLETNEYRKIVNHIKYKTEAEQSPVPTRSLTTDYITKRPRSKLTNRPIDFTSTSEEDDFSSDLITTYVKKKEHSHRTQALEEEDEASVPTPGRMNHKITTYTTELTTEPSLKSHRRIENETTLIENVMTTNRSQTFEEDSLISHHTSKLENQVNLVDDVIGSQDDAVTSLSSTSDNDDISLENTNTSEGTKKSLSEDQTTDASDTSIESQYTTTVSPTLYTLNDLPLHDFSGRTPSSMSTSQVLATTTNVPEILSREFSNQDTYAETNAPETSRPVGHTTTMSSELYTSTNFASKISSIAQNTTTDSSNENTSTIVPKQGTSTEPYAPHDITDVLASATNMSSSPASATATPLSSVRSTTVSTPTSTKGPQRTTTKTNKKGVAKRRRKTGRQPCKGHLNKKGQKGKSGPGGRRRRRKTTPAARRTTRPSSIRPSTIASSKVSSTTTPPTTITHAT